MYVFVELYLSTIPSIHLSKTYLQKGSGIRSRDSPEHFVYVLGQVGGKALIIQTDVKSCYLLLGAAWQGWDNLDWKSEVLRVRSCYTYLGTSEHPPFTNKYHKYKRALRCFQVFLLFPFLLLLYIKVSTYFS